MTELNQVEVRQYLPHRFPFLMIDKVIAVEPGKSLVAIKNVTTNEPFFIGHFPQKPVMPGVMIIESLAQASGILIFRTIGRIPGLADLHYLAGINNARFKRMVVPGDQLRLEVEILKRKRDLWKFQGVATVDGEVACTAEFMNVKGQAE